MITIKYEWHSKGALTTNIHHVSQNKLVFCTENIFSGKMCTIYAIPVIKSRYIYNIYC